MLRLSKLADYATVIMCRMARRPEDVLSAAQLSNEVGVPLPTVAKLMKLLCRSGLLVSIRGGRGGYRLARGPERISMAEVISAVDGPLALTECSAGSGLCSMEDNCGIRVNWGVINRAIVQALGNVSLAQMNGREVGVMFSLERWSAQA
jgi:FeS assembly SUF system regulator